MKRLFATIIPAAISVLFASSLFSGCEHSSSDGSLAFLAITGNGGRALAAETSGSAGTGSSETGSTETGALAAATGTISLNDTPTGWAGVGNLNYKTTGTAVIINASDPDAITKLKNAVKNGNAIVYINGMIDATYSIVYGGSMLPSSYSDDSETSPLGKFIAAKTSNTYKTWDKWRLTYAAACDNTSHKTTGQYSSKDSLVAGTNNPTLDGYQTTLVSAWKSQIQIPVGSNTTIIGLTADSGIKGGTISISGNSNVIIRNLHFKDAFDPFPHHEYKDGWNAEYDCITVQGTNDHFWIDHCTFEDTISVGWTNFAGVKLGDSSQTAIEAYQANSKGESTSAGYEMWQTYDGLKKHKKNFKKSGY